jgi:hypothetical protein
LSNGGPDALTELIELPGSDFGAMSPNSIELLKIIHYTFRKLLNEAGKVNP